MKTDEEKAAFRQRMHFTVFQNRWEGWGEGEY